MVYIVFGYEAVKMTNFEALFKILYKRLKYSIIYCYSIIYEL